MSPKGGAIPIGYINTSDSLQKKYLYDGWFMDKLEHTMKPNEIIADNYIAIFYSGGGAAMYGIAEDTIIQNIARNIYNRNGVISTICHGTAGIAFLKDEKGKSLYAGKKNTGFPDKFENKKMVKLIKQSQLNDTNNLQSKSDLEQITEILIDYIEGTANGQPEKLRKAFHPNFNLYTIAKDTLWTRSGEQYISNIKLGEKSNTIF